VLRELTVENQRPDRCCDRPADQEDISGIPISGALSAELAEYERECASNTPDARGDQFFQSTPFHAISEISQWLELQGGTNPDDRMERLARISVFQVNYQFDKTWQNP